jgi:hypothetical protein
MVCAGALWLVLLACLFAAAMSARGQDARDAVVEVSATVQESPAQITLAWLPSAYPITLQKVYRRLKGGPTWIDIATPAPGATSFTDTNVAAGISYEYFVYRSFTGTSPEVASGYVNAGIALPAVSARGRVLLIVDATMATPLATELARLEQDLIGDGWTVARQDVARTASVPSVKAAIQALYQLDPARTRALLLFGHVPVPYSGNIAPDGHPEHQGAWPADVYFGDMNGTWTDTVVNNPNAARPENRNIPGDGKFDQSILPSDVELEVGRVDLADMFSVPPGVNETELLRRYLNRNHDFRHRAGNYTAVGRRGLIDDNFGFFGGEAFAASGWRNFTAMFGSGPGNVVAGDWFTTLDNNSYLWAYGCGSGTYQSASGVGSTSTFGAARSLAVFTMLFGSYHGDWDNAEAFLRAPLAGTLDSLGLACMWAGRPAWHVQHMALGETLGYGARLTQNNTGSSASGYAANNAARFIHIALMGDPTLRLHPVAPPTSLTSDSSSGLPVLTWTAAAEPVPGYRVLRATSAAGPFQLLAHASIATPTFTDRSGVPGHSYHYLVQSLKLETSASGTYHNTSQGAFATGSVAGPVTREINIRGNGRDIVAGDTAPSVENGTHFGGTTVSGGGITRTFTIANDGTGNLALTGSPRVQISGPQASEFIVETPPASTVAGGSAGTFVVRFTPQAVGPRTATVTIASDDSDEATYTFALAGSGDPLQPDISVTPASITRALAPGATAAIPLTVQNTGTAPLQFTLANSQNSYGFLDSTAPGGPAYAWTDISATGTEVTGFANPDDGLSTPIAIGFAFPFYGGSFTTLRVCTNGFISFTDTTTPYENTSLPGVGAPRNLIAVCWDDLILENGARIFTQQIGGSFIVQFDSVQVFNQPGQRFTCQIILKPTGEVLLLYHTVTVVDHLYTIGIQNGVRTEGLEIAFNSAFAQAGRTVRIVPPALETWLSLGSTSGTMSAGSSQVVVVNVNATGLVPGAYGAAIDVASNDPDEPAVRVPVALTVLTPIEVWRQTTFGSPVNSGPGGDGEDPDFDGITNLREYAFALEPLANEAPALPAVSRSPGGHLQIQFTRHLGRTDLLYEVEAGSDLAGWNVIARSSGGAVSAGTGAHSVAESGSGDLRTVTVADSTPMAGQPSRFLRVRIRR